MAGSAPMQRITLLHGFTQTGGCWGPLAEDLGRDHHVITPDAPGHGSAATVEVGVEGAAKRAVAVGGRGIYVGYSMGGRVALRAALDHPHSVTGLVLISTTAGIGDPAERSARRRRDEALATRIERIGIDAFLREWLSQPLFATLAPQRWDLEERRRNTSGGLASSLRLAGTGAQEPLWHRLAELSCPLLVITGALDEIYCRIGGELVAATGGELVTVEGAGHSVHRERPEVVISEVRRWLGTR